MGLVRGILIMTCLFLVGAQAWANQKPKPNLLSEAMSEAMGVTEDDSYEFNFIEFEQTVLAPKTGEQSCKKAISGLQDIKVVPVMCRADPMEQVCARISKQTQARANDLESWGQFAQSETHKYLAEAVREVEKKLGRDPSISMYPSGNERYDAPIRAYIRKKLIAGSTPAVEKVVSAARDVFIETVGQSRVLLPEEKDIIREVIAECSREVVLDVMSPAYDLNASSISDLDRETVFSELKDVDPKAVHPGYKTIKPLHKMGCTIKLTYKFWRDCAEGRPICYDTLFHEFAHAINSCRIRDFVRMRTREKASADRVADPDIAESMMGQALEKVIPRAENLMKALESSTSCLNELSQPKSGIPNACPGTTKYGREDRERCGQGALKTHPTQWNEAEADFWAASAMARYFEKKMPSLQERQEAFYRVAESWCYNRKVIAMREVSAEEARHLTMKGTESAQFAQKQSVVNQKEDTCLSQPMNPKLKLPPAWNDTHQTTEHRYNRNYLRNTDLRRALGCNGLDKEIPMSCSPLGIRVYMLPK